MYSNELAFPLKIQNACGLEKGTSTYHCLRKVTVLAQSTVTMALEYGWNHKKSKMPALIGDFVKTSQYIIQNKHAPEDKSLPYAVCLAHANYFMKRDAAKNYNKRAVQQAKAVDKLLSTVDSVAE